MKALKLSGYRKVVSSNFKMPVSTPNPCVADKLTITEIAGVRTGSTTATITWKTNFPANSQLRITSKSTGQSYLSPVDTNLVTAHTVLIDGLDRTDTFSVEVISVDANGVQVIGVPPVDI
jgi:hypothetical protein